MTISGGSIQHFVVGQGASLECRVQGPGLTSPPLALYWERGNKVSQQGDPVILNSQSRDYFILLSCVNKSLNGNFVVVYDDRFIFVLDGIDLDS